MEYALARWLRPSAPIEGNGLDCRSSDRRLLVHVLAIACGSDLDHARGVVHLIDHAVDANPNAPEVARATQLAAAGRARCLRERLDSREDSIQDCVVKALKVSPSRADEADSVARHSVLAVRRGRDELARWGDSPWAPERAGSPVRRLQNPPRGTDGGGGRSQRPFGGPPHLGGTSHHGAFS